MLTKYLFNDPDRAQLGNRGEKVERPVALPARQLARDRHKNRVIRTRGGHYF